MTKLGEATTQVVQKLDKKIAFIMNKINTTATLEDLLYIGQVARSVKKVSSVDVLFFVAFLSLCLFLRNVFLTFLFFVIIAAPW